MGLESEDLKMRVVGTRDGKGFMVKGAAKFQYTYEESVEYAKLLYQVSYRYADPEPLQRAMRELSGLVLEYVKRPSTSMIK